jgi:hypothetical protein
VSGSFTLTGKLTHHDKVTPHIDAPIHIAAVVYPDGGDNVVYSQGADVVTDAAGTFSVSLLTETDLYYTVTSQSDPTLFEPVTFLAPTTGTTLDLSDIVTTVPGAITPSLVTAAQTAAAAAAASASSASASAAAAVAVGSTNDTIIASRLNDDASAAYAALRGRVFFLPLSNGTDDTTNVNSALSGLPAGGTIKGIPGQTYKIASPLVIKSGTKLDMTGCTIAWAVLTVVRLL